MRCDWCDVPPRQYSVGVQLVQAMRRAGLTADEALARLDASKPSTSFDTVCEQRDAWIRRYMQLEVAITHHRRDTGGFATDADERLYKVYDRIINSALKEGS